VSQIDDDVTLVRAALDDPTAFGALYERYARSIFGYCYRWLGSADAAEDVTSTIFMRALAQLSTFRGDGSFRSWLFAIAFRTLNETKRRRTHESADDDLFDALADPDPLPLDRVIARDDAAALRRAVESLPGVQREVVLLRLAGLSTAEIAAALGKRHDAIRAAQSRAFAQLRSLIREEEVARGA